MDTLLDRYSRQILFDKVGEDGQRSLLASHVVLIGCGALGSVLADTMVRAGVGFVKIVDRDFVEENNLQRQVLFDEKDVSDNLPKAEAARRKLEIINSNVTVEAVVADVNFTNVQKMIEGADVVLDGTDNFEIRFLINDACVKNQIPWIYGACVGSTGMTMTVIPGETPCFRCMLGQLPIPGDIPTCDTEGVLAPIVNIIASLQAAEAIKLLTGNRDALRRDLVSFDVWAGELQRIHLDSSGKAAECPTCKLHQFDFLQGSAGSSTTTLCGRNAIQVNQPPGVKLNFKTLSEKLKGVGEVSFNKFMLRFAVDDKELTVFADGRAIIKGTNDSAVARGLYAKYIGS